ncbi:MAG: DUF4276 family protein [Candidatus Cloacimonetes bacterium]|jgi:hypothetical protein|nr:DUF4276 family protein [Candidatus Cloacimonadota bacterium]MDY0367429.1 DUF4276 family protein [Candidatus Syntrophosphaera sp.]
MRRKKKIVPVVEGFGEERAVPCLIRRWLYHRRFDKYFEVTDLAVNAKGCGKLKAAYDSQRHIGIEHYIEAAVRIRPDAILVIVDADDECLKRGRDNGLGPVLLARARAVASHIPLAVVVANREYEAWFLASLTSIRQAQLLPAGNRIPGELEPEAHAGCKRLIADLLSCPYEETTHQLQLTGALSLAAGVQRRSPSYAKLMRDLDRLVCETRR